MNLDELIITTAKELIIAALENKIITPKGSSSDDNDVDALAKHFKTLSKAVAEAAQNAVS